jgi:hypothetical protein
MSREPPPQAENAGKPSGEPEFSRTAVFELGLACTTYLICSFEFPPIIAKSLLLFFCQTLQNIEIERLAFSGK